jgi:hypothetical protein
VVPLSADAACESVVRAIIALERSCLEADAAIVERRWPDVAAALDAQGALTLELGRLFDAAPECGPDNDARVQRRVRGIVAFRDAQLRRLRGYHADVVGRLSAIGKVNALARSLGKHTAAAELLDGQY